ncbi:MAG TPA: MarR family transcriptional regulator [Nanoarchaeota archaeon]|nr:MarR family transcriptional regulator [Nanoarchaeota archaeon]
MGIEENRKAKAGVFGMFFRQRPIGLLLELRNIELRKQCRRGYSTAVAKGNNCTYSYAVKLLQEMEKMSLIASEKDGRIKTIRLTEKGNEIAEHIEKLRSVL